MFHVWFDNDGVWREDLLRGSSSRARSHKIGTADTTGPVVGARQMRRARDLSTDWPRRRRRRRRSRSVDRRLARAHARAYTFYISTV